VLRAQDPDVAIEDFNSKWQQEIEKLLYVGSDFSYETISDLTISFVRTAEHYAKTIVLELNSPLKTIQEIKSNGILGGRKYVVGGIFFKLAEGLFQIVVCVVVVVVVDVVVVVVVVFFFC
jgi:hypothetical protein